MEGKARDLLKKALWVLKLDLVPGPVFLLPASAALEVADTPEPRSLFPESLLA